MSTGGRETGISWCAIVLVSWWEVPLLIKSWLPWTTFAPICGGSPVDQVMAPTHGPFFGFGGLGRDRRKGCLDERDESRNEKVGKMESEESGVERARRKSKSAKEDGRGTWGNRRGCEQGGCIHGSAQTNGTNWGLKKWGRWKVRRVGWRESEENQRAQRRTEEVHRGIEGGVSRVDV